MSVCKIIFKSFFAVITCFCISGCWSSKYNSSVTKQSNYEKPLFKVKIQKVYIDYYAPEDLRLNEFHCSGNTILGYVAKQASKRYPDIFSEEKDAIPLSVAILGKEDGNITIAAIMSGASLGLIPIPWYINSIYYYNVTTEDENKKLLILTEKNNFSLDSTFWLTFLSPLALLPVPGSSTSRSISFMEHPSYKLANAVAESVIDMVAKAVLANNNRQRLTTIYSLRNKAIWGSPVEKCWAINVGLSKYATSSQKMPNLEYAVNDSREFTSVLKNNMNWSSSRVKQLVNSKATKSNIIMALKNCLKKINKNDLFLLYWSGHGYADPEDSDKTYLACYDTNINKPQTGLLMKTVINMIKESKVKNVIIIVDTCYAGGMLTGTRGFAVKQISNTNRRDQPAGWIYMLATEKDRKTVEDKNWKHGAFTYYLLEGLKGKADAYKGVGKRDKQISLGELRAYIVDKVPAETQKTLGRAVHPIILTNTADHEIWRLYLNEN